MQIFVLTFAILLAMLTALVGIYVRKLWLFPFLFTFIGSALYYLLNMTGLVSIYTLNIVTLMAIVGMLKLHRIPVSTVQSRLRSLGDRPSWAQLVLIILVILVFAVRLLPLIEVGSLAPVGPNAGDAAIHAKRALNLLETNFNLRDLTDFGKRGVNNDTGLYPIGFPLVVAITSGAMGQDPSIFQYLVITVLAASSVVALYGYLRSYKFSQRVSLVACVLTGLSANILFWHYFSEYPAIASVYALPAILVLLRKFFETSSVLQKIIIGFLVMGYSALHMYLFLYAIMAIFASGLAFQAAWKKGFPAIGKDILLLVMTSLPLSWQLLYDLSFYRQSMFQEDSLVNRLTTQFWGHGFGLSLPPMDISNAHKDFAAWLRGTQWIVIPLGIWVAVRKPGLILPFVLGWTAVAVTIFLSLESPYNRIILYVSLISIPVLLAVLEEGLQERYVWIVTSLLAGLYITTFTYFSYTVQSEFSKRENVTTLTSSQHEVYSYLRSKYPHVKSVFYLNDESLSGNTYFWLPEYFLKSRIPVNVANTVQAVGNQEVVIVHKQSLNRPEYQLRDTIDGYAIYTKNKTNN